MKCIKQIAFACSFLVFMSCNMNNPSEKQSDLKVEKLVGTTDQKPTAEMFETEKNEGQEPPGQGGESDKKQKQPTQVSQTPAAKPDWDKKIIKTAAVNLEVKDYNKFYTSVREKVASLGGYIAQEEQQQTEYKVENKMTIKVPVDQFDNAVALLTASAQKINERKISSQDVTGEVIDTRSRMEAKKQVRQRYMDLLAQAKNMEEILNVQSQINGIQEDIESATGRIEYLSHAAVFSTIDLTYYQVLDSARMDKTDTKPSFGEKVKDAFSTGWDIVSQFFLVLITIWPLLLCSFLGFLLYKKLKVQKPRQA